MAFDPKAYLAGKSGGNKAKFDPKAYLASKSIEPKKQKESADLGTQAEAFIEGLGQTATFGMLPELQALAGRGAEALGLVPGQDVNEQLRAQGFEIKEPETTLEQEAAGFQRRGQMLEESAPVSSGLGKVAGILAPGAGVGAVGTRLGIGAATTGLGRVARGAATGGAFGFLQKPEEEKPFEFKPSARAEQALTGAAFGGAASALPEGIKALGRKSQKAGRNLVLKSLGIKKSTFDKITQKGTNLEKADDVADELLRQKIVRPGDSIDSISQKLNSKLNEVGSKIGKIYDDVDGFFRSPENFQGLSSRQLNKLNDTRLNTLKLSQDIAKKLQDSFRTNAQKKKAFRSAREVVDSLLDMGDEVDLNTLQQFRRSIDKTLRFDVPRGEAKALQRVNMIIRNTIKDATEKRIKVYDDIIRSRGLSDTAKKSMKPALDELKQANKTFSRLSDAETVIRSGASSEKGNRLFDLTGTILGSATAGGGIARGEDPVESLMQGLAVGLGARGLRRFGPAVGGPIMSGIGQAAQRIPQLSPGIIGGTIPRVGEALPGRRGRALKK